MQEIFARDAKATEHPTFRPSPDATRDAEPDLAKNSSEPKSASGKLSATERLRRLEQQKARLQLVESKIKTEERKARTRRLIELGGLVDKAGLADFPANALYGALIEVAKKASDPLQVKRWELSGGRAFAEDKKTHDADREPLVLTLPPAQPAPIAAALRAAGLRANKVLRHWEGLARYDDVLKLATEYGGVVRRVAPPPSALATTSEATNAIAVP